DLNANAVKLTKRRVPDTGYSQPHINFLLEICIDRHLDLALCLLFGQSSDLDLPKLRDLYHPVLINRKSRHVKRITAPGNASIRSHTQIPSLIEKSKAFDEFWIRTGKVNLNDIKGLQYILVIYLCKWNKLVQTYC